MSLRSHLQTSLAGTTTALPYHPHMVLIRLMMTCTSTTHGQNSCQPMIQQSKSAVHRVIIRLLIFYVLPTGLETAKKSWTLFMEVHLKMKTTSTTMKTSTAVPTSTTTQTSTTTRMNMITRTSTTTARRGQTVLKTLSQTQPKSHFIHTSPVSVMK